MLKQLILSFGALILTMGLMAQTPTTVTPAQTSAAKNVDVSTLSQGQVNQISTKIKESGMSVDQALDAARLQGASESQISDLRRRLAEGGSNAQTDPAVDESTDLGELEQDLEASEETEAEENSTRTSDYDQGRKVFGAYLFNSKNLTFQPSSAKQTPKNYTIGINDELIITIWGNSQNNYQLRVNDNGQLHIPDVGPLYIAGLTFNEASAKIKERLTGIYADMGGDHPQTFAQINMGQLRSIQVNLVGEVQSPGTYTLPVTASVFNALYLSGGPSNIGSFRNIKLIRNNKVHKVIDVYDFLVKAEPGCDVDLLDGDMLFIPPAETQVEVKGEFKRQGLFEMKQGETLAELIQFAGGFTNLSYRSSLQITRIEQDGMRIIDVEPQSAETLLMKSGDILSNQAIFELYSNRVTIQGTVYRPGDYAWEDGLLLSTLILKADSITPDADLRQGHILRYNPDLTQQLVAFTLSEVLNGEKDYLLFPEDVVYIKSHFAMQQNNFFSVTGHVMAPGTFTFMDSTTVRDAIYLSDGLRDGAYAEGYVVRTKPDRSTQFINFAVADVLSGEANFPLQKEDVVTIKAEQDLQKIGNVTVKGQVNNPQSFSYMEGMTLRDALYFCDGLTEGADSTTIEVSRRLSHDEEADFSNTLVHRFILSVNRDLQTSGTSFQLEPYDQIYVRQAPNFNEQISVMVTGEVKFAGSYSIEKRGQHLSDLVAMAGGLSPDAFLAGATLVRRTGLTAEDIAMRQLLMEKDPTINLNIEPETHVAIRLDKILEDPKGKHDLLLKPGDKLHIPDIVQTVKVSGEVLYPVAMTYTSGMSLRQYVNRSGGFSSNARRRDCYVIYANGSTRVTHGAFGIRKYPRVLPGAEIIIPEKPDRSDNTGTWLAIVSTVSSLALTAATIVNLTK